MAFKKLPKGKSPNRNIKKIFSCIMCFGIAALFLGTMLRDGFSISRLVFGIMALYFSISFFITSKE